MTPEAGKRLRALVERHRDPTQTWEEFAASVGVTKAAVFAWFSGRTEPSLASITALAKVLGVSRADVVREMDG